ncbi:MAG: transcriptional regulator, MerR family [Phenylobacterium sp.]|nr:transcriptional regulator, MerR family [Phenylobacterium sp.]
MNGRTVSEVAKLSGVSVRTLHHYDEVGLLKPACVGANGYRYYGREELLRLQQILFHRELGFSLEEIGRVLDADGFDRVAALKAHRARLVADVARYRRLVRTIDDTLAALEGESAMDDKAMYMGFDPKKQAEHEAWLVDRFGGEVQGWIDESKATMKGWTGEDFARQETENEAIEADYATALAEGLPADCATVQAIVRRQHAWIGKSWNRAPTRPAFIALTEVFTGNPAFRARYEGRAPGLTEYIVAAMRAFAETELS